jgi:hypothetical protein
MIVWNSVEVHSSLVSKLLLYWQIPEPHIRHVLVGGSGYLGHTEVDLVPEIGAHHIAVN